MEDRRAGSFVLLVAMALSIVPTAHAQEILPPGQADDGRLKVLEFRALPLRDALRLFSEQTGVNVVASAQAADVPVSLFLHDVTPRAALSTLTKANNLFFREDPTSGIVTVFTNKEFEGNLRSFREERTRVFTLLYPNASDAAQAIADIYGDRVILSGGPDSGQVFQDLSDRFDRFDLVDGRSQGLGLFSGGNGGNGGGGGGGSGGFGSGISGGGLSGVNGLQGARRSDLLRDSRADRRLVEREAATLRPEDSVDISKLSPEQIQALVNAQQGQRGQQVVDQLIRMQQASIYITVIRRQNQVIIRTSDEETMKQMAELIQRLDVPTPLVLLEVKIMEIDLSDDFNSVFDYQFTDGNTLAGQFTNGNILPPAADALAPGPRRFAPITPGGTGIREGDMLFQFVNDNFRFRMQLLETKNRVTELATPLLLTANNEVSRLFVGEEVLLNRSFTGPQPIATGDVVVGQQFGAGSTAIEFRPVGTTLLVTPSINADRSVTLRILQETSEIQPDGAKVLVPTDTGFAPQLIDTVRAKTVSGTVVAKDGLAVAIGGLIQDTARDNRAAVPVVGKLPVIGFFFRRQNTVRSRTELVVMIRPYVFNTPTEASQVSHQLLDILSLHPTAPDGVGTLGTFAPNEVVRPNPPLNPLQTIFRFHNVEPKVY